ncbi:MAG: hypothetical protein A3J24_01365 [Deltaproteobacteria bacterium RIFCSPLOWO2_02_FULL_53_8]|nr:MAG: hypothetical protein A3J24_01365 [Deltaproteobacteria bacterium RIFCSPLOWO2_02_FULL_53_8]
MAAIPRAERKTQSRGVNLFAEKARSDCLGYRYLVKWNKVAKTRDPKQVMMQELLTGRIQLI